MIIRRLALLAALALATPATAQTPPDGFAGMVSVPGNGAHVMGNPKAATRIVEYMSYTCPHCARFEAEAALPLRLGPVAQGKASWEVRHLLLNPVDATVAVMTNCAPPKRFFVIHHQMMTTQDKWMAPLQRSTPAQRERWNTGPFPARMRAMAADFALYDIAAHYGLSRSALDRCFADEKLLSVITQQTANADAIGVKGTPTFLVNDQLLEDVHDWKGLQPYLAR